MDTLSSNMDYQLTTSNQMSPYLYMHARTASMHARTHTHTLS